MVPFNKPYIVGKELFYIAHAVFAGRISGDGIYTKKCSEWFETNLPCKKALLTHSCTAALEMAAILCDIQHGDEVIMPSYTFVSTANAFVLRGGVPVFVDIRPDTLNIDETLIEAAITPKTRAIVCVHYAGVPCEMDTIMDIARKHNLSVIEDAAQGFLSYYKGKALGTIGDMGTFSFHETKNVISGEGGAIILNKPQFIERAEIIREKGTNRSRFFRGEVDKYTWVDLGSSYLPGEIIAAFLYAQLEEAEKINAKRKKTCTQYYEALAPLAEKGFISLPYRETQENVGNGHMFYVIAKSPEDRNGLIAHLKTNDIWAIFHYIPLHSSPAGIRFGRTGSNMSVTEKISDMIVRLPLYYEISDSEIAKVINDIFTFYK